MYTALRALFILCLISASTAYGRQSEVYRYPNGQPRYILNFSNDTPINNTYLAANGDTIYSWNLPARQIMECTFLGEYLLPREYDSVKAQRKTSLARQSVNAKDAFLAQTPRTMEWKNMHDRFFDICPDHTRILREGDFTISIGIKNGVPDGSFKKYYLGRLVTEGRYINGNKTGIWHYYPYYFYPYKDITVHDPLGKEYSLIYTLLPALACILLLLLGFVLAARTRQFDIFFYSVIGLAIVSLVLRLYIPFDRYNVWVRHVIPAIWAVFWYAMIALCTIDLFIVKKTNIRPLVNFICLLFGIGLSIYILLFKHLDF